MHGCVIAYNIAFSTVSKMKSRAISIGNSTNLHYLFLFQYCLYFPYFSFLGMYPELLCY